MTTRQVIEQAKSESRSLLTEIEAKNMMKEAGIGIVETELATTKDEAVAVAGKIGYPVVLKIVSPEVIHKSDAGGVKLNLRSDDEVGQAWDDIMSSVKTAVPEAVIQGVSVQKMARPGVEIIIGMSMDAQFGPVMMFGLGGILVEVLKDVSFRIVPLEKRDAREMIREVKGFKVLEGFRGQEAVDLEKLEDMLLKVSAFVEKNPEIEELDLNPVIAYKDGALAVDARVILGAN